MELSQKREEFGQAAPVNELLNLVMERLGRVWRLHVFPRDAMGKVEQNRRRERFNDLHSPSSYVCREHTADAPAAVGKHAPSAYYK